MAFRADDIRDIIAVGSYPFTLSFHAQELLPRDRRYPHCETINVNPEGSQESFDVTQDVNTVEVRVMLRYNRVLDAETQDLFDIENEINSLLKSATLSNEVEISSNFSWSRTQILNNPHNVHGIQSTLRLTVTEVKSTSGIGVVGGDWKVTLPGLSDMQLINKPVERDNESFDNRYDDSVTRVGADYLGNTRSFFGEVESNDSRITTLRSLKNARDVISATLSRNGVDEVINCKIVSISNAAPFSSIETVTFQLEVLP